MLIKICLLFIAPGYMLVTPSIYSKLDLHSGCVATQKADVKICSSSLQDRKWIVTSGSDDEWLN